jgi:hypothetical protein
MKKANFVQDAKLDPARYYRTPTDVIRDRRLTNKDRLEILAAWERTARARQEGAFAPAENEALQSLRRMREDLQSDAEATAEGGPDLPDAQDA